MASTILWMEYRRSRTPSAFLRTFWLVKWIGAVFALVVFQSFTSQHSSNNLKSMKLTFAVATGVLRFIATTVLALFCCIPPTPITVDMVMFPQDSLSPTALLYSQNAQRRFSNLSNYGSFRDYDWVRVAITNLWILTTYACRGLSLCILALASQGSAATKQQSPSHRAEQWRE